jgi:cytochrome c556
MNRAFGVVGVLILAVTMGLSAQKVKKVSDEDYSKAMKEIGPLMQTLRKNVEAGNAADAAKDAARLEVLFRDSQAYWEARKTEDAIAAAKLAVTAAGDAAKAASANNMAKLGEATKTLGGTCMGCHNAHRERLPDGTYRIK